MRLADDRTAARGQLRWRLLSLLAMSGVVLLTACANIANLLAVRSDRRWSELSMRSALGATRGRLMRLLLVEGTVIATLGAVVAVACAAAGARAVFVLMPAGARLSMFEAGVPALDLRVLVYSLLAGTAVALLASIWPALRGARATESTRIAGATPDRRKMTAALQSAQTALALVLVTGAALAGASFAKTVDHDLGFDPKGLGWFSVRLPAESPRAPEARTAAFADILARTRATPGVTSAALGQPPLSSARGYFLRPGDTMGNTVWVDIRARIGLEYFRTVGMRVIEGREFSSADAASSGLVAIIDVAVARRFYSNRSPIGQRFQTGGRPESPWYTIIGVVNEAATSRFNAQPTAGGVYLPLSQANRASALIWVVIRSAGEIRTTLADATRAVQLAVPSARIDGAQTTDGYLDVEETFSGPRFYLSLMSVFAALALFISSIGLYGVMSFGVAQREREIGVRVALGSSAERICWLVVGDALRPVGIGIGLGLVAALALTRYIAPFLFAVNPRDPMALAASAAVLLIAAAAACAGPLRRATGGDPIHALRG